MTNHSWPRAVLVNHGQVTFIYLRELPQASHSMTDTPHLAPVGFNQTNNIPLAGFKNVARGMCPAVQYP